jgi:hypothetical protein
VNALPGRRRTAPALALILVLAGAGIGSASCGLSLSDLSSGGVDPADGASTADGGGGSEAGGGADAALDADRPSSFDAAEAGPRKNSCGALLFGTPLPLFNGDFELGCGNGWKEYVGTATEDTTSPSQGAIACRVCNSGGNSSDGFFISGALGKPILAGESYELVACARAVPGDTIGVATYAELNAGTDGARGSPTTLGATYVPVRGGFDVPSAHPDIGVNIRVSPALAGQCFLVDDLSLSRIRDASTN